MKNIAKIYSLFWVCLLAGGYARAQSTAGITPLRDTSFTTYSAFISTLKTYPGIKIVPELHTKTVLEKRNIPYCNIGERLLKLDAFYPGGAAVRGRTAIIIIHGGGWRSGNRSQHYPLAQRLAALGYVCFTPEYRLSTEALYPAAVYDLKSAVRFVYGHAFAYHIDTARIAVLGFSAGGELAAFLGTTMGDPAFDSTGCYIYTPAPLHAVVDIDGTLSFTHPESGEGDDSKRTSAATYWFGYSKKDNPALWEQASPLAHVSGHTPPTLFINSSVDRMHAGREDYIKVLNEHRISSQIKNFDNAPHSFCLFDPWFEPTVHCIDAFLKKIFP